MAVISARASAPFRWAQMNLTDEFPQLKWSIASSLDEWREGFPVYSRGSWKNPKPSEMKECAPFRQKKSKEN